MLTLYGRVECWNSRGEQWLRGASAARWQVFQAVCEGCVPSALRVHALGDGYHLVRVMVWTQQRSHAPRCAAERWELCTFEQRVVERALRGYSNKEIAPELSCAALKSLSSGI